MKPWARWTLVVVVIVSMLGLSVVPWYLWAKPDITSESRRKAQELHDLATQSGMDVPSVDTLERIYGTDGGYAVQVAESSLREAALLYTNVSTGEVLQRPSLAEARYIGYSMLVLKVYAPDLYRDEVLPYVKGLKIEDESKYPAWLRNDLAQLE